MAEKITLILRVAGETTIEVDRAEYEAAKTAGKVDHFLDVDLSNLDGQNTVVEPDGRSYNPFEQWHGPDGPPAETAAPAIPHGPDPWDDEVIVIDHGPVKPPYGTPERAVYDAQTPHGLDPGQVC